MPDHRNRQAVVRWLWDKARRYLVNRYVLFLVFMTGFSHGLSRLGGLSGIRNHLLTEGPILLCFYYALNSVLRPGRWAPYVAALPIVALYAACDVFYIVFGNVLRLADFANLPELWEVLPLGYRAVLALAIGTPVILSFWFIDRRKYRRILVLGALAAVLVGAVELFPGAILTGFELAPGRVVEWGDAVSVWRNGRFAMLLLFEAKRRQALAETARYRNGEGYETGVSATAGYIRRRGNNRNIHVVVLESFVDPTLFKGAAYSMDPRHPDFAALIGDGMGFSMSPVFGGMTAQAEFEVLCGVPALHELSNIEFNVFTGAAAGCMPSILAQAGYATIASNAYYPSFYNTTKAYTGIGFGEIYFPAEYARHRGTYLSAQDVSKQEEVMFDGVLFKQNLDFVAKRLRESPDRPILNYVLSMYGHEPHLMDPARRPLVLSMKSEYADAQLLRAANQYWYRTGAIARYVRALTALDPNSLIIMVSDHLPPLTEGMKSYRKFRYLDNIANSIFLNRLLVVENGKVVRHETMHHYEIPALVYEYLTSEGFCAENDCHPSASARRDKYMSLMAHAVGPPSNQKSPVQLAPSPRP